MKKKYKGWTRSALIEILERLEEENKMLRLRTIEDMVDEMITSAIETREHTEYP